MNDRTHVTNVIPLPRRPEPRARVMHPSVFDHEAEGRPEAVVLLRGEVDLIASLIRGHIPPGRARDEALELLDGRR